MPVNLIVQGDSVLVPNANALCSLAFADEYHNNRGNADWIGMNIEARKAAVIKGTDFLVTHFIFRGSKKWSEASGQVVSFPRTDMFDKAGRAITGVPLGVQRATAELAYQSTKINLYGHSTTSTTSDTKIQKQSIKIGPLEESTTFETGKGVKLTDTPIYQQINNWLSEYMFGFGQGRVIRS